jgi:hypothetical protein
MHDFNKHLNGTVFHLESKFKMVRAFEFIAIYLRWPKWFPALKTFPALKWHIRDAKS